MRRATWQLMSATQPTPPHPPPILRCPRPFHSSGGPYTLFAPTDAGFTRRLANLLCVIDYQNTRTCRWGRYIFKLKEDGRPGLLPKQQDLQSAHFENYTTSRAAGRATGRPSLLTAVLTCLTCDLRTRLA